jgi:hypothetical protein
MVLKCQQMEMIHIKQEFVGGLNMPEAVRIFPPSIRLRLTEDRMEFRPRYGWIDFLVLGRWNDNASRMFIGSRGASICSKALEL